MTRLLKKKEIEDMLDFLTPQEGIPYESALSIVNHVKDRFRKQLKVQKVNPKAIPEIKQELEKQYYKTLIQPGECVGIIAAQSIGEKNTQLTLNSFHKAGQSEKSVTTGVPRFQELMSATKKPKLTNCKIYFNSENTIKSLREIVGHTIVGLTLPDVSLTVDVYMEKTREDWYDSFKILYNDNFEKYTSCISIKLNMNKLFEYKLGMKKIADTIDSEYHDVACVFSPNTKGQLDIFIDTSNIVLPEKQILFITSENAPMVYIEQCALPDIEKILLAGISGIREIYYLKENDEWLIETDGSNLRQLMSHPDINEHRTISNNVWDIYHILGIEAARAFLISEFMLIMEGINDCHAMLVVDRMTYGGTIAPISRHTLKYDDSGPMGKASFEECLINFLKAGAYGEIEPTKGVSSSIICGKRAKIGTGMMDLRINIPKLPNPSPVVLDTVRETTGKEVVFPRQQDLSSLIASKMSEKFSVDSVKF